MISSIAQIILIASLPSLLRTSVIKSQNSCGRWAPQPHPLSQCPGVPVSQYHLLPVSQYPRVVVSQCPSVPVTWGGRRNAQGGGGRQTDTHTDTQGLIQRWCPHRNCDHKGVIVGVLNQLINRGCGCLHFQECVHFLDSLQFLVIFFKAVFIVRTSFFSFLR